jgi:hypothetical protein
MSRTQPEASGGIRSNVNEDLCALVVGVPITAMAFVHDEIMPDMVFIVPALVVVIVMSEARASGCECESQ